jgi:hypothetical protein
MVNRPAFIDGAYCHLTGKYPDRDASLREVMEVVVAQWDASILMQSEEVRKSALIAMCQIAMRWHPTDRFPYSFEDVCRKVSEIAPELSGQEITARTLRGILEEYRMSTRHF